MDVKDSSREKEIVKAILSRGKGRHAYYWLNRLKTYNRVIGDKVRILNLEIEKCKYTRKVGILDFSVTKDVNLLIQCSEKEQRSIQNTIDMLKDLQKRNGREIRKLRNLILQYKRELQIYE